MDERINETLKIHAKVRRDILKYCDCIYFGKMLGEKMWSEAEDFLKVADEAFDLLDMDDNGTIERGDIE